MRAAHQPSQFADLVAHLGHPGGDRKFYVSGDYARWFACALFSAAAVTDWLDGHMARRWQQQSEIGRFLDPIADKLLVSATLFMLTTFGRLSAHAVLPALVILC